MQHLVTAIEDIREKLRQGVFSNEDQVSKGVVMRLLQQLGWDVYDPTRVSSEFKIGSRKVDYALRYGPLGSAVLIEVKDVGKATPKGEDQLFDYCFREGVPLAVLTDGRIWNFYWPAGRGKYEHRRFASVDLIDGEVSASATRLLRYLAFAGVASGRFEEDARHDYTAYQKQIVAREKFPEVLTSLVTLADERFVLLFCDEVEKRCAVRPADTEVIGFLGTYAPPRPWPKPTPRPLPAPASVDPPQRRGGPARVAPSDTPAASFTLFGNTMSCRNDTEVLVGVLKKLGDRDPALYERLAPHLAGRTRSYLARDRRRIYPEGSTEMVLGSVEELSGGWWVGTHSSTHVKNKQLERIRDVAGVSPSQFHWRLKGKTG